jgi:hypothetical protein
MKTPPRPWAASIVILLSASPCPGQQTWSIDTTHMAFPPNDLFSARLASDSGPHAALSLTCFQPSGVLQVNIETSTSPLSLTRGDFTQVSIRFDRDAPVSGYFLALGSTAHSDADTVIDDHRLFGPTWLASRVVVSRRMWLEYTTVDARSRIRFTLPGNTRAALTQIFRACHHAQP